MKGSNPHTKSSWSSARKEAGSHAASLLKWGAEDLQNRYPSPVFYMLLCFKVMQSSIMAHKFTMEVKKGLKLVLD